MRVAFLIDKESIGGGCEYIRRESAARVEQGGECRTFYSSRRECRVAVLDAWGADEIVVNHLKALLQLLGMPWKRPRGRVQMVVHGIHLRKYMWRMRESARIGLRAVPSMVLLWVCYQTRRMLEALLYHRCDEIVTLTESDRDEALRLYGARLRVIVKPNTLDGWEPRLSETLPTEVTGPFEYICIGRFCYPKGQDRWVEKVSRMKDEKKATVGRTLFIGDGETLEDCKRLATRLGVLQLCVFAGSIPEAERYLKCARVVVSPSRWEGMPYLLMKARALGCRVLATDCPGNRDVLAGYEKWEMLEL